MLLQVVLKISKTKETKITFLKLQTDKPLDYYQVERKIRPKITKLLGHRDYTILFTYEISKKS